MSADNYDRDEQASDFGSLVKRVMGRLRPIDTPVVDPALVKESEARENERLVRVRLTARGIPQRQVDILVAGAIRETAAVQRVRRFMAEPPGLLVLVGGNGCGKSTAAALAAATERPSEPYAGNISGLWPADLYPKFRYAATFARVSKFEHDEMVSIWDPYLAPWLLVLDDLGMEYVDKNGNFSSMLDELLARRHGDKLRTIITANLELEKFRSDYGERIYDRLKEGGTFSEILGGSMRGGER